MEPQSVQMRLRQLLAEHPKELSCLAGLLCESGENGALLSLLRSGGNMLPGELAGRLELTSGRIANILRGLEAKGMIQRLPEADDGRKMRAVLTPAGSARAQVLEEGISARLDALLERLGAQDGEAALRILEQCLLFCRENEL